MTNLNELSSLNGDQYVDGYFRFKLTGCGTVFRVKLVYKQSRRNWLKFHAFDFIVLGTEVVKNRKGIA